MTTVRSARPWPTYALGVLCIAAVAAAILLVGPASGSPTSEGRTITVAQGVVQSTVSGSGNVEASSQLDLGFKTSGVVTQIYVSQGQHVTAGQLLAELDPTSAEVTLEQAKASLQAAAAGLLQEEETDGESATGGSGAATGGKTSAAAASASAAAYTPSSSSPAATAPRSKGTKNAKSKPTQSKPTQSTPTHSTPTTRTATTESAPAVATAKATVSPALREANIASARAAVKSDRLTVQNAEESLANTKLYAPKTGTIVSLSGEVGETVSGGGTTKGSSSSPSSGSGGSGSSAASALGGAASATASGGSGSSGSGSSGSGSSASSSFAVLSDLSSMQLVVPLSESEVGSVRVGQPATVTIEALESTKLAAEVLDVATLPTSTSGVVSYDVTFQLDQLASGLKPGMSATAEVVVKQAEGVNVPTTAISADTVTVVRGGKQVRQRVVTGLAGDSSTIVLSGVQAGEKIVLPLARASTGATSLTSRLGSRLGGAALGGGLGGAAGATGGGAFLGGGGFRGG
ncbi:MAG TPA: HlyD family efflux transporter periplasmic adaptor subunit [Solirubrobacteraceae bacterium]|jgi:HlyD family secretion protein|nr:HlyD family efflux transporter periplasmic adaptor subunit [Solirubrobacteraceae bacterium]